MRLITGVFLSEADIAALAAGTPCETVLPITSQPTFPSRVLSRVVKETPLSGPSSWRGW